MSQSQRRKRDVSPEGTKSSPRPIAVRSAIEEAFHEAVKRLHALVEEIAKQRTNARDVLKAMPEIVAAAQRAETLARLAYPSSAPLLSKSAEKLADLWRKTGAPEAEIQKILQMAGRRKKGRPPTLRAVGLQALELHTLDPHRWTWKALAQSLCLCGGLEHGFKCRENLRREVLLVKRELRNLDVRLPT